MTTLAIIGGTGLNQIEGLEITSTRIIETPYGYPSSDYIFANVNDTEIVFLARHGTPHIIPPHKINYRANIWGLKECGVTDIIAIAAVGGISSKMSPAHIALPDQIIDYSYGREHTFFAENLEAVTHIDFSQPYSHQLRADLIQASKKAQISFSSTGTYGCTQGPRLESSAEIKRMERDGCDLVGMTGMPEAALAKELNIRYATIAVIANWAAGKSENEITMTEIELHLKKGMTHVLELLKAYFVPIP